jgi:hypothetical protein
MSHRCKKYANIKMPIQLVIVIAKDPDLNIDPTKLAEFLYRIRTSNTGSDKYVRAACKITAVKGTAQTRCVSFYQAFFILDPGI